MSEEQLGRYIEEIKLIAHEWWRKMDRSGHIQEVIIHRDGRVSVRLVDGDGVFLPDDFMGTTLAETRRRLGALSKAWDAKVKEDERLRANIAYWASKKEGA